jgi:hypothetical protein
MFVHAIFARFGRQNRVFGQDATEREKRRDWLAEKIGFELVVAFRCTASSKLDFDSWESPSLDGVRIHNVVDAKAPSFNTFNRLPEGEPQKFNNSHLKTTRIHRVQEVLESGSGPGVQRLSVLVLRSADQRRPLTGAFSA